ncbi:dUTP diphosphatase [Arvimicrobium flavum]|uniref:dUTP diphosphatase n=1 Tax=Arvimicrobium flavum TaxID=3393320 RepID=UPI00237B8F9D|nr:dUTP diphosphatase [Mesorhizobium shangrilense]
MTNSPAIGVVRLPHSHDLPLPAYETEGAAGMDLRAAVPEDRMFVLLPGKRALIPTGLILEIPEGFEGQVRPRSGLAFKHGVTCLNTPGTIDSDYRGEVQVLLINHGEEEFRVTRGLRIAQIVFAPVTRATVEERSLATGTARGAGGFGSTGTA